jgi:hypothetical protein
MGQQEHLARQARSGAYVKRQAALANHAGAIVVTSGA